MASGWILAFRSFRVVSAEQRLHLPARSIHTACPRDARPDSASSRSTVTVRSVARLLRSGTHKASPSAACAALKRVLTSAWARGYDATPALTDPLPTRSGLEPAEPNVARCDTRAPDLTPQR